VNRHRKQQRPELTQILALVTGVVVAVCGVILLIWAAR
jgi:CHASE3 domain sensor protein